VLIFTADQDRPGYPGQRDGGNDSPCSRQACKVGTCERQPARLSRQACCNPWRRPGRSPDSGPATGKPRPAVAVCTQALRRDRRQIRRQELGVVPCAWAADRARSSHGANSETTTAEAHPLTSTIPADRAAIAGRRWAHLTAASQDGVAAAIGSRARNWPGLGRASALGLALARILPQAPQADRLPGRAHVGPEPRGRTGSSLITCVMVSSDVSPRTAAGRSAFRTKSLPAQWTSVAGPISSNRQSACSGHVAGRAQDGAGLSGLTVERSRRLASRSR